MLVTEAVDARGDLTITISLPSLATRGADARQRASGIVSEVDQDAFVVQTSDGSQLRLHMAPGALAKANLQVCDSVDVSYHQDAATLVADRVNDTGSSNSGDCSDQQSQDEVGTITQVSASSITVATQDNGSMTFAVDSPDITTASRSATWSMSATPTTAAARSTPATSSTSSRTQPEP